MLIYDMASSSITHLIRRQDIITTLPSHLHFFPSLSVNLEARTLHSKCHTRSAKRWEESFIIQGGQHGNQIGAKFWELVSTEHTLHFKRRVWTCARCSKLWKTCVSCQFWWTWSQGPWIVSSMVHMAIPSGQTDNLILGQFSKTADVAMSYPCPCPCFLAIDRSCIFILLILCNQIIHVALCLSKTPSHPSLPQYTTAKKNLPLKHGRIHGIYWSYPYFIFQIK